MSSIDTLVEGRRRRGRYMRTMVLTVLLALGAGGGIARLLVGQAQTIQLGAACGALLVILLVGLPIAFGQLRCPSCNRWDIMLAYPRATPRACPKCGAALG